MSRLLITGATGFLGGALVDAACAAGHEVVALSRGKPSSDWEKDNRITHLQVDLGNDDAGEKLQPELANISAVIHAAASFSGDETTHARDTVGATENLIAVLNKSNLLPRLVLVSSLSVYDVAVMKNDAILTDKAPLVTRADQRDAYAVAKVSQERVVQNYEGSKQIIRPGAIFGPK